MKVVYVGATDGQVSWGGNDDPRDLLQKGQEYEVKKLETHKLHTKVHLTEFPGKAFNSVCFEGDGLCHDRKKG